MRRRRGMPCWAAVLACGLAAAAQAQGLTRETLAETARLSGDVMIANACHLRPDRWSIVAVPAVTLELDRMARRLEPSGGLDPAHVADVIDGAMNQAIDEGTVQFARYGEAACKAIQADGSLARIDALVAGFRKPD